VFDISLKKEIVRLNADLKSKEDFCRHLEESIRLRDERLMALLDPAAYAQFKRFNMAQRPPKELTEEEIKVRNNRAREAQEEAEELKALGII